MKRSISIAVFLIVFTLLIGWSCSSRGASPLTLPPEQSALPETQARLSTDPQAWIPPVFPGAVADTKMQANMTAVATTPEALDDTASNCFGFTVHDAVFYAYSSDADAQEIMDFYSEQMAAQGWKRIAIYPANSTLNHRGWQQELGSPLVAYVMVMPMKDGRTLIYVSVAKSNSPQTIIEE